MEPDQFHASGLLKTAAPPQCGGTPVFEGLHHAAGPQDTAPIGACVPIRPVDPACPTLVLTHGMRYRTRHPATMDPLPEMLEISGAAHERMRDTHPINILHFVWPKAARHLAEGVRNIPSLVRFCIHAFRETDAEGQMLAMVLRETLGGNYRQPVHFVGHSYGALVNAHAVHALSLQDWGREAQFTALDVALHLSIGKERELRRLLAGGGRGLRVSRLDNYFGPPFYALGTGIRGAGPGRFGGGHRVARTHCGVMAYYRDTIQNPRMKWGFNHSILADPACCDRLRE
jgi:hypothetical protein